LAVRVSYLLLELLLQAMSVEIVNLRSVLNISDTITSSHMKKTTPKNTAPTRNIKPSKPAEKPKGEGPKQFGGAFWLKAALFVFAFILYGNTLKNGYSLDDLYVTYNNPVVNKGIKAIPQIISSRYINLNAEAGGMMNFGYRPLTKIMFAVEHQLFGESPAMSHFINVLLYALTLLVLFSILRKLLDKYSIWFPFLVTLLWAAHPVHTEVVASLKNREEILSLLFGLCAFQCFLSFSKKNSYLLLVGGALLFLLGIFSKLSSLPLLAAIPFALFFFKKANVKQLVMIVVSMVASLILAVIFIKTALPETSRPMLFFENPLAFDRNIIHHVATGMYGLLLYIKLLVYPHPLLFYYGYNAVPIVGLDNVWVWLSIALHLGMFVYAIMKFREKHLLSFAILFYLILMSMYSNFIKPPAGIIAERFLYISTIGFSIAVVYFAFKLLKVPFDKSPSTQQGSRVLLLLCVMLIPFTARTVVRNNDWNSQLSLFSHDIEYLNNSAKANYIYATTLKSDLIDKMKENGNSADFAPQIDKVIGLLQQTVKVYPGYFEAWNSLGEMYAMTKNDYDKALDYFKKSAEVRPNFAAAWFNIGYASQKKDDLVQAIASYRKAFEIDSMDVKTVSNLAFCLNKSGNMDEAVALNKRIIRIRPQMELPYMNLAMYYYKQGDTLNAIHSLEDLVVQKPEAKRATGLLSRYYASKGNKEKADHYRELFDKTKGQQ